MLVEENHYYHSTPSPFPSSLSSSFTVVVNIIMPIIIQIIVFIVICSTLLNASPVFAAPRLKHNARRRKRDRLPHSRIILTKIMMLLWLVNMMRILFLLDPSLIIALPCCHTDLSKLIHGFPYVVTWIFQN